jgi:polyphenol oxidase
MIAMETIHAMEKLGAEKKHIRVAIGPGICGGNYEVSEEVIGQFRSAGFPGNCWSRRNLDLKEANRFVLESNGISPGNIWTANRCSTEPDFFSYRRDHGKTGRMWSVITL